MIWIKFSAWISYLLRIIVPPSDGYRERLNPNEKCPVCGWEKGEIAYKFVEWTEGSAKKMHVAEHLCHVCGYGWYEPAISTSRFPVVHELLFIDKKIPIDKRPEV